MYREDAQRAFGAYGRGAEGLPKIDQLVLLYDAAIRRVREAEEACRDGRVEDRFHATSKATAILDGLQACLDFERGGEIARHLDRLYTYLVFRLQQVNMTNDPAICREIAERLGELRSSWARLAEEARSPGQAAVSAAFSGLTA